MLRTTIAPGPAPTVFLAGEMDLDCADSLREAVAEAIQERPKPMTVLAALRKQAAEAEKMRATDAENTIFGIKRLVGRAADSPAGRLLDASSAFKIRAGRGNEASVLIRGSELQASEIASIIAWLASDEGGYATGADFSVNGGLHMG